MLWSSFLLGKDGNGQYAIGVARSQSGTILGPWLQDPQPLNPNDNGGHAMILGILMGFCVSRITLLILRGEVRGLHT